MKISLLIIASEILEGKVQDISTFNLSKMLKSRSLSLNQVLTVSDNESQIINGLNSLKDSDLIIVSGGLGPTPDDLTKFCLAKFFNCSLIKNVHSTEMTRKIYEHHGKKVPDNHPYQQIPAKASSLFNSVGYAPGLLFKENTLTLISLPGVPAEFLAMAQMHLPPLLDSAQNHFFDFIIRTQGIDEEAIFNKLDEGLWEKLITYGTVASLPYLSGVDITIRISADTLEEVEKRKKDLNNFINAHPLKNYIWHIGQESLEACIINKAKALGIKFGFAESCTAGLCSSKITDVNGSSSVFYGSVVCYHSEIKTQLLKVSPELIEKFDVVSSAVAEKMASGLMELFPIDIAISLTGHAGPHNKEDKIPTGTVYISIVSELGNFTHHYQFRGSRERLKEAFAQAALFQLLKTLEKLARR